MMCCSKAKRQIRNQERQLLLGTRTSTSTPSRIGSPPPYSQVDKQHTPFDLVTYNSGREKTSPTHSRQGSLAPLSPAFQAELCPPQIFGTDECLARGHEPKRKYGAVGIIAGIAFFPWGLFW
ncbi:hypothetical protein IAR55_002564 [Kwoniella newhampshirensis]|uniref:Uncharacterized protein n=1 Tax=Kwoniella newhampshirensis TaxID=1651941 RepID=A0AAW0Z1T7_9TREE